MKRKDFIQAGSLTLLSAFAFPFSSFSSGHGNETKKVVLLGDSIRMAYQPIVKHNLPHIEIWAPEENCRTTDFIIYNLHNWIRKQKPDLVHINAGLHDIRTLAWESGPGNTIVKPAHYKDNMEVIFNYIREFADCKIIWATTTPVIDERVKSRHEKSRNYTRYDADVKRINTIAKEVSTRHDVIVNDLYSYVKNYIGMSEIKQDGVHFTEKGSELLGKRVTELIMENL